MSRKTALVLAGTAAAALAGWIGSASAVTWHLTRRARAPRAEPVPAWGAGRIEELRIETSDGERLGAWLLPREGARTAVIVLHGHGGSRTAIAAILRALAEDGFLVLAPTLRAHGDSTGERDDFGWSAREDVAACVAFLEERAPGMPILVYGTSLGAVAAVYAARDLGARVAGYALEAPYRDLASAVRHRLEQRLPLGLDRVALSGMVLVSPAFLPVSLAQLAPVDRIADVPPGTPVVFLSGGRDPIAPTEEVESVRSRCGGRARLVVFPEAGHAPLFFADPGRFRTTLLDLAGEVTPP